MSGGFTTAIRSHVGVVRYENQDSGYSGKQLFFVADGMGGHAGGDVASALVTKDVSVLDNVEYESVQEASKTLEKRLLESNKMLSKTVVSRPELAGMGTTFCGFIAVDNKIAVGHIGDSRLYLFRDGVLKQITKDHTFVQRLVDSGRITEEEAAVHPRRSVLMRVLGDVDSAPEIDTEILENKPGDIWLLCSDGLCGYVEETAMELIIKERESLDEAADSLIDVTLANGAPDNVTVVLVEATPEQTEELEQTFVGSAAKNGGKTDTRPIKKVGSRGSSRWRRRLPPVAETQFEPRIDEYLAELIAETKRQARNRRFFMFGSILLILGIFTGIGFIGYEWTQTRYYVGTDGDTVIIYQGVKQNIGSFSLSSEIENTNIPLENLNSFQKRQVEKTLIAGSLDEAREIVIRLGGR